ncbi:hypothetical protein LPJ63_000211 [Coemansia sp. RSA 2711]|nr:hypothetical protein LPJ63_000211 [Coemansia sp. RSA 2711]KAJ1847501.1 hypothetical protein LPJ70_001497 [Coemansia sp. RSA 2708]KAJ2326235.1 hypothetical protein IWW51_002382 [Coemansia sp. RSA 2702]
MTAARKIFVVGGSGFVGQAICRAALVRGWKVLSLSRHGAPERTAATQDRTTSRVDSTVQWIKGNALEPKTFEQHLSGCDAVVHSVGVLMENGYKKLANAGYITSSSHAAATYESANRDTALCVARAARRTPGVGAFAYISASDVLPFIDSRYISTKREVERELLAHRDQVRPIILRPGFMFSSSRPITLPIAAGVDVFRTLYQRTPLGCVLKNTPLAKAASPTLRRELVAEAIINAIADPQVSGILEIADIERVGRG